MKAEMLRQIQNGDIDVSYEIVKKCIDKFFFDLILYCYDFDTRETITIDCTYLPYHLITTELLKEIINYLEKILGYSVLVQKSSNVKIFGHEKGDMLNINIYNKQCDPAKLDKLFFLHEQRTIYSTFHKYSEIHENIEVHEKNEYRLVASSNLCFK